VTAVAPLCCVRDALRRVHPCNHAEELQRGLAALAARYDEIAAQRARTTQSQRKLLDGLKLTAQKVAIMQREQRDATVAAFEREVCLTRARTASTRGRAHAPSREKRARARTRRRQSCFTSESTRGVLMAYVGRRACGWQVSSAQNLEKAALKKAQAERMAKLKQFVVQLAGNLDSEYDD
jgi:hypothetical protein